MSSAICFDLDQSKILSSGNGLITKAESRMIGATACIDSVSFSYTNNMVANQVSAHASCKMDLVPASFISVRKYGKYMS